MPSYYHVMIMPKRGADPHDIEETFNLALDWFRFHPSMWVIYTNKDAEIWYHRLKEFIQPGGHLFVCKLDISDRHGWLPRAFWDWIEERQSAESETSLDGPGVVDALPAEYGVPSRQPAPSET